MIKRLMIGKKGDFAFSRIVTIIIALLLLIFVIIFYRSIGENLSKFLGGFFS